MTSRVPIGNLSRLIQWLLPTPRKLNRRMVKPRPTSATNTGTTTLLSMLAPFNGTG